MIKVKIKNSNGYIEYLKVSGHAEYAEHGKDLVCAGVSAIMYGLLNALDGKPCKCSLEDDIIVEVLKKDQDVQNYLELAITQLETIAYSYKQNVKIVKE